jgi:hypothetical protein
VTGDGKPFFFSTLAALGTARMAALASATAGILSWLALKGAAGCAAGVAAGASAAFESRKFTVPAGVTLAPGGELPVFLEAAVAVGAALALATGSFSWLAVKGAAEVAAEVAA